jgi:galactose mutarotase-like enzyme
MRKILKTCGAEGVVDTLGGELISYKKDGREYIWTGDPAHWSGHAPVLFPFVSALKDGRVRFDGVEYTMKGKHGFARKSEFELVETDDKKAVFRLAASDVTLAQYSYRGELYVTHEISCGGYTTTYTVKNTDERDMLFCIGGHPGFFTDGPIEDYKLIFEEDEDCALYYTDADSLYSENYTAKRRIEGREFDLRYGDFDIDALISTGLRSRRLKLLRKTDNRGIEFDFTGFPVLVLWSPPKKQSPFVSLEPWVGLPAKPDESGEFADKPYAVRLEKGGEYMVSYKVTVI